MRVLSIVHEREAGSGVFGDAARARGDDVVEWIPAHRPPPVVDGVDAALVFGGATHADQELEYGWLGGEKDLLRQMLVAAVPTLGVCLGAQLLAEVGGGAVTRMPAAEIGWTPVELVPAARHDALFTGLPDRFESFQWHSYEISLPVDAITLAHSRSCLQAFRLERAPWWGIQFHAEATHETIAGWIDDYRSDEDAVRAQLDLEELRAETARRIDAWNELGVGICARFLERTEALLSRGQCG